MKSKTLSGFIVLILFTAITSTDTSDLSNAELAPFAKMWDTLFSTPRNNACSKTNLLARIRRELIDEGEIIVNTGKSQFGWVKHWGYGHAAYLFDYIDPILQAPVVAAFKKILGEVKKFPNSDSKIPDPFDYKKIITKKKGGLAKSLLKRLKLFTKNFDKNVYEASVNLPQVQAALTKWKWSVNTDDPGYFRRFIIEYDMNFDGRLNPREIILALIYGFPQTIGSPLCDNCFNEIGMTLDAIFLYLDCNNDGLLSAEEMWANLPRVKRGTPKWNIFAFGNDESIRTAAVNDFILKNTKSKDGYLNKAEFKSGILLGYWDRQTEKQRIFGGDKRSLKSLRWKEGDMIDIAMYSYHRKKMIAKYGNKNKKRTNK